LLLSLRRQLSGASFLDAKGPSRTRSLTFRSLVLPIAAFSVACTQMGVNQVKFVLSNFGV
jgi:hypothetical protein